jgi:hypothetical protein
MLRGRAANQNSRVAVRVFDCGDVVDHREDRGDRHVQKSRARFDEGLTRPN